MAPKVHNIQLLFKVQPVEKYILILKVQLWIEKHLLYRLGNKVTRVTCNFMKREDECHVSVSDSF